MKSLIMTLIVLSLTVFLLWACVAVPATPEVAPATTGTAANPSTPTGDDWSRVQAAGEIVVASPLDNQPFNMYDEDLSPDGFDIALMENVARRLGLQVEFIDVPFEGLLGAVQLGQADAAIAAMAVTPDRQATVDFTQTYYVGEDGILAAPDSDISAVQSKADVADRRVGVVRGTVYESWLRHNLIETGEMPSASLHVYLRPDDAVRELGEGYIDLVVLDREPALSYADQGLAKLVGQSQYSQNFAIPVRKESTLLPHLNEALTAALADGTVAGLIQQYLNIDKDQQVPIPTPTSQPTARATATPAAAVTPTPAPCVSYSDYGSPLDLTVPDGTVMQPGQRFDKGWRMVNTGTCNWTADYSFVYAKGDSRMGGQDAAIGKAVPVGKSYDAYVTMMAPSAPGIYTSYWQMEDAKGVPFGKRVSVKIQVLASPPPPTQTPSPNIGFTVDRDHINQGECAYFTLNVTNVENVWFNVKGQPYVGVPGQSTQKVCPTQTTTYELRVEEYDGSMVVKDQTIYVTQVVNPPVITQFRIDPQSEVILGHTVTLWWEVQGQADRVALLRNGAQLYSGSAVQGSYTDQPPEPGLATYELQASGPGGSANPSVRQVNVKQEAPPPPAPTITRFDSIPQGEVIAGQCLNINWELQGQVDGQELKVNGNRLPVDSRDARSYQDCDCPRNPGTCTYELNAWGSGGNAQPSGFTVTVREEAPPPPEIIRFDSNPSGSVLQGQCVNLSWDVQAGWDGLELKVNGNTLTGGPGPSSYQDCECPKNTGACNYELRVWNQSGEANRALQVDVVMDTLPGNPAATFCQDNGGQYDDGQGTCTLGDGTVCDAWAYYNGQCP